MVMTTGSVTKPNYLPMKAGIKASFHHVIGAIIVEVDGDGTFFCRQLIAEDDGAFYDLDRRVSKGHVSEGHRVEALTPGDVHTAQIDPTISDLVFGVKPTEGRSGQYRIWETSGIDHTMVGLLNPRYLFIHDVSDFRARNHHEIANPHKRFEHHCEGNEDVAAEMDEVSWLLDRLATLYTETKVVVVDSNHDQALVKWLQNADYRYDPVNALFFLDCQLRVYTAIAGREPNFSIFEHVMRRNGQCKSVTFLREDDSFVVGDVEYANHGHRGPNGSRGSVAGLIKVASKMTIGHVHSCAIRDGLYAAGTTSKMDLSYNSGPSSWSHSLVVQYANGKRTLVTIQNGRWRL
jgi:hypothetical protein